MSYHFQFITLEQLPDNWDQIVAPQNRMLSKDYFHALNDSLPDNMKLAFIAYYNQDQLIGGALLQRLFFDRHDSFNPSKRKFCGIRNYFIKLFVKQVTILGNNMLSGQNGFYFDLEAISKSDSLQLLMESANAIDKNIADNKLTVLKDYNEAIMNLFPPESTKNFTKFQVQPTMILQVQDNWQNFEEYYNSMKKKYRARIRTARKKMKGIERKELSLVDLKTNQETMYQLYMVVAEKAGFNTFFLPKNHFYELKKNLKSHFNVVGYFSEGIMIGFYTIIHNYKEFDTYFLGYEEGLQKKHQLYLNMLLDMVQEGIEGKVAKINFGRTALEIKSTIGAVPKELYGLMHHKIGFLNKNLYQIFKRINMEENYQARSPFS